MNEEQQPSENNEFYKLVSVKQEVMEDEWTEKDATSIQLAGEHSSSRQGTTRRDRSRAANAITPTNSLADSTSTSTTTIFVADEDDEDETEKGRDTDGEDTPTPRKRRRRVPRPPVILTDEEMVMMAEFLKQNDCLYNKSRDLWRDSQARARLLDQQGRTMNRTRIELQQWYESLRTKLGRIQRKIQTRPHILTDGNRRLLQLFDFLTPHMSMVQRRGVLYEQGRMEVKEQAPMEEWEEEEQEDGTDKQSEVLPEMEEEVAIKEHPSDECDRDGTQPPSGSSCGRGEAPQRPSQHLETDVLDQLISCQQNEEQLRTLSSPVIHTFTPNRPVHQHPDREQFTSYIGSVLQQLPDDLYRKANRQLNNLLLDIQDEASTRHKYYQLPKH